MMIMLKTFPPFSGRARPLSVAGPSADSSGQPASQRPEGEKAASGSCAQSVKMDVRSLLADLGCPLPAGKVQRARGREQRDRSRPINRLPQAQWSPPRAHERSRAE